jgi:uncharacterized protein with NRDE domain
MCLIVFAWKVHPAHRLILAANRDEFYRRPSQGLHWWPDQPDILAGRDLQAGGTWLATARSGRFATVTNYREQQERASGLRSRGEIVTNFVSSDQSAREFNAALQGTRYAGFSLLTAERDALRYVSNRGDAEVQLEPGVYGLSNANLDTPWPKLLRTRAALSRLIETDEVNETSLLRLMIDRKPADIADIANDNVPFELARALTAPFIQTAEYGTRCTSILFWSYDENVSLTEKRFDSSGTASGESRFTFVAK